MGQVGPAAEAALERDEEGVGRQAKRGQKDDRREHLQDLEVVLGVHHLEPGPLFAPIISAAMRRRRAVVAERRSPTKIDGTLAGRTTRRKIVVRRRRRSQPSSACGRLPSPRRWWRRIGKSVAQKITKTFEASPRPRRRMKTR